MKLPKLELKRLLTLCYLIILILITLKKRPKTLFFEFNSKLKIDCIKNLYKTAFSQKNSLEIKFQEIFSIENNLKTAIKLSNFGWKKEAIPVAESKKSLIVRFFDAIFG